MRRYIFAVLALASCDWRKFDDLADETWMRRLEEPGNIQGDYGRKVLVVNDAVVVLAPPRGVVVRTFDSGGSEASEIALEPPPPIADEGLQGSVGIGGKLVVGANDNIVVFEDPANLAGGRFLFATAPVPGANIGQILLADGLTQVAAFGDDGVIRIFDLSDGSMVAGCDTGTTITAAANDGSDFIIAISDGTNHALATVTAAELDASNCPRSPTAPTGAFARTTSFEITELAVANLDGDAASEVIGATRNIVELYPDSAGAAIPITPPEPLDGFGEAIVLGNFDGDADLELVVGAPAADPENTANAGAAVVFDVDGTGADHVSLIHDGEPGEEQQFGKSLSILELNNRDVLVVGGNLEAFIYWRVLTAGTDPRL